MPSLPIEIEFLKEIDDWEEKYLAIMELGESLPKLNESQKNNLNRVIGCQSRVWLVLERLEGRLNIQGEADSRLVQGLLAIVVNVYNHKTKQEIMELGSSWITELGLGQNLSMVRQSGLQAMVKRILEV
jgi:cysteine desulfuration protein SufE